MVDPSFFSKKEQVCESFQSILLVSMLYQNDGKKASEKNPANVCDKPKNSTPNLYTNKVGAALLKQLKNKHMSMTNIVNEGFKKVDSV